MTDFEAVYGPYRAVTCEWIGKNDERCRCPVERGKSYCEEHYWRVYRKATTKEAMDEAEDAIIEAETVETPKEEEYES